MMFPLSDEIYHVQNQFSLQCLKNCYPHFKRKMDVARTDVDDKKASREQRATFFKRVAELLHRDHVREMEKILEDSVIRSMDVETREWRENAIRAQLNRLQKKGQNDDLSEEDDDEVPPYGDDEILLDTPNLRAVGVFLFQKKNPPYRRRMVTSEFSIVY